MNHQKLIAYFSILAGSFSYALEPIEPIAGLTKVFLEGRAEIVASEETNLGNLVTTADLEAARTVTPGVVAALKPAINIGSAIGNIDEETGEASPPADGAITAADIIAALPMNEDLVTATVTVSSLLDILEVSINSEAGAFLQVSGLAFSFDPILPNGNQVQTLAIKNSINETLELLVQEGELLGSPDQELQIVTTSSLAAAYALTGSQVGSTEQEALTNYLSANFPTKEFSMKDTPKGQDARIQNLDFRSDSAALPVAPPAGSLSLEVLGRFETGVFDEGAAEIISFDPQSQRLFLVNANTASIDILDLSIPEEPVLINHLDLQALLGSNTLQLSPNSVTVKNGLVAVAIARENTNTGDPVPGLVSFFNVDGDLLISAGVGFLPDMVTFTPDTLSLLVANEGEPNDDYTFDPEGSISIIDIRLILVTQRLQQLLNAFGFNFQLPYFAPQTRTADFRQFNLRKKQLLKSGVRIFGPGATVAQDLEPEFIVVSPDSKTAYVTLQENNAIAVVNLINARVTNIEPLGLKDFTESGLDPSNRDDSINIQPWPVLGMYQPDALALYQQGKRRYLVTSNEGDARDYDGFSEEVRLSDLELDPGVFPDFEMLLEDSALGRLRVTNQNGDLDGDGDLDEIHAYGGRSFSIWEVKGRKLKLVFDSGSDFENFTASLIPAEFNSTNDENDSFDSRSDDKGPEPEGIELARIGGRDYAFIGLERVGGIMLFDITDPKSPVYLQYAITRDFFGDAEEGTAGDLGPEGLTFIPASDSPNGRNLLLVANEISGSVTVLAVNE